MDSNSQYLDDNYSRSSINENRDLTKAALTLTSHVLSGAS